MYALYVSLYPAEYYRNKYNSSILFYVIYALVLSFLGGLAFVWEFALLALLLCICLLYVGKSILSDSFYSSIISETTEAKGTAQNDPARTRIDVAHSTDDSQVDERINEHGPVGQTEVPMNARYDNFYRKCV